MTPHWSLPNMSHMVIRLISLVVLTVSVGCSSLPVGSLFKRTKFAEAGPKNPVVDLICIWEPAEGQGLDGLPGRGFAGQFLFLTQGSNEPAKVNGQVRVYVFDDQGTSEEQGKPIHQFDFEAPAFAKYFYETSFGAAYQMFIPYTRKGSQETRCGLRVRFTPADGGPPVYSKMADVTLPGAKPKTADQRWHPQHRQLRADVVDQTGGSPATGLTGVPSATTPSQPTLTHAAASIPLNARTPSRSTQAISRLQQLSAQLAESQYADSGNRVEHAVYEEEAPEPSPLKRFRLHEGE
ncbi:MAG: hypothetical protein KF861_21080 [Planctomycetaceae bacterium]|nr:hypothetical protein [Planctomycetaceae bacterium]